MVDAALLLVDAQEGPKPQTRFVLKKAIAMGLKILVVVNKVDKPSARPDYVVDKTFDLFCDLGASDEQTDFPIVYASAINRVAGDEPEIDSMTDMEPLFQKILELPKPPANPDGPLQLQIASLASDNFIGRLGIGRITSGKLTKNTEIGLSAGPGTEVQKAKIAQVFTFGKSDLSRLNSFLESMLTWPASAAIWPEYNSRRPAEVLLPRSDKDGWCARWPSTADDAALPKSTQLTCHQHVRKRQHHLKSRRFLCGRGSSRSTLLQHPQEYLCHCG